MGIFWNYIVKALGLKPEDPNQDQGFQSVIESPSERREEHGTRRRRHGTRSRTQAPELSSPSSFDPLQNNHREDSLELKRIKRKSTFHSKHDYDILEDGSTKIVETFQAIGGWFYRGFALLAETVYGNGDKAAPISYRAKRENGNRRDGEGMQYPTYGESGAFDYRQTLQDQQSSIAPNYTGPPFEPTEPPKLASLVPLVALPVEGQNISGLIK